VYQPRVSPLHFLPLSAAPSPAAQRSRTDLVNNPPAQLAPEYESLELGIGESLLMKAIGESCGRSLAQVKAEYKKIGDLGEVAFNSRTRQKTLFKSKPLTVRQVFDELKKVAKTSGDKVRHPLSSSAFRLL